MNPADWIAGAVTAELLSALKDAIKKSIFCKKYCKRLEKTLQEIMPILDEIIQTGAELPQLTQHRQKQLNEFYGRLQKGTELIKKCSKIRAYDVYHSYKYSKEILSLERYINNFNARQGWAHMLADIHHLRADVGRREELLMHQVSITERMNQMQIDEDIPFSSSQIPELPEYPVGLENSVDDLKKRLTCKDISFLAIKGIGGSGKTTLAGALCSDPQIKEFFTGRIVFETVSQSPNLRGIIERMWTKIFQDDNPDFQSVEDAHRKFQHRLQRMRQPTLVVLDDVWNKIHLDILMFKAEGYKTVITTRNSIVEPNLQYELQLLREADALSLFCFWAFRQQAIPETEEKDIVEQVIAKCKGLPLNLKVVGSFLYNQHPAVWSDARNKLSRAESLSECHKDGVISCIERSITILENEVQECFLDLGAFPEDRKNSVASLLDLWVYVHDLEWNTAYRNLIELKDRNLVNLVNSPTDYLVNAYDSTCELFTQHDVLRDTAIYLTMKDAINGRKRLLMAKREDSVPAKWKRHANYPFNAEIVSLHTGMMREKDWCQMSFPEAKALILNFSASEYFLPPFLHTMQKLKVLIIVNHSSKRAALKGLSVLSSLSQLKSVRLERLIVPPLHEYCQSWQNLEKLSLILCEGCGNMNELPSGMGLNFPRLIELSIDHCSNLEELPESICNMTSLQKLSVTNCHDLYQLSDNLGKLSSLQMLRLYACPSLEKLPYSVCKLRQLKFLDISLCECLKQFPDEFGQLSNLRKLDMRECSHLKQLPKSSSGLSSLVHVICDERIGQRWSAIKASSIPSLKVEVAEEHFHLDWLED